MSIDQYKKDLDRLLADGARLYMAMIVYEFPNKKELFNLSKQELEQLPDFRQSYQSWYSESVACISHLLPDRLEDFISYYKPLKPRKEITFASYTVSDYLKGTTLRRYDDELVAEPRHAIPAFQQQLNIVKSLERRFESTLFDIQALVQADLFDNELDAAEELNKKGFRRGGGAIAGVVLEGHLRTICQQHKLTVPKNATLAKLNNLAKEKGIFDVPTWRFIQHLIDLRNLCGHKKAKEPSRENVEELIEGVRKITKTVF